MPRRKLKKKVKKLKVKKPYKRNISNFITDWQEAVFDKKVYINQQYEKLAWEEKNLLGVFDTSQYNLASTKTEARKSLTALD